MTPDQVATLEAGASRWGVSLSAEVLDRLTQFLTLLALWNPRLRLTGETDVDVLVAKHMLDCLAPARYLASVRAVVDVGSGGGFPGIILACLRPDLDFVLLDARRRPISFLNELIRNLPLPRATAVELRAEEAAERLASLAVPRMVISRGLRVETFLPLARPLIADDSIAVTMQTPQARGRAIAAGAAAGLSLVDSFDYDLSGGEARSLYAFRAT